MNHEAMWSTRYRDAGAGYLFGTLPNRFLAQRINLFRPGERALLVADGEGRNSVWLAEHGVNVTAFDISAVAVAKANQLAAMRKVTVNFAVKDMLAADWVAPTAEQQFDWVIGIFIQFAGPAERDVQFARMQQMTRPGGHLLLQGYTPKQLDYRTGGPSAVENLYTADMLRQYFAGWEITELVEYEDEIEEGPGHKGKSALVGLIARKPA